MSIQKNIYYGIIAVDVWCAAQVERLNRLSRAIEAKAGLAYANALHRETAAANQKASLYATVAEVAKRDAATAKADAATIAKSNNTTARRLESTYA